MKKNPVPLFLPSEDGAIIGVTILNLILVLLLHYKIVRLVALVIECFFIVDAIHIFRDRWKMRQQIKFSTPYGLFVISKSAVDPYYVMGQIDRVVEFFDEATANIKRAQIEDALEGCVIEVVDAKVPDWCLAYCPWPHMSWPSEKWIRVGVNPGGVMPALPHEIAHRVIWHIHKLKGADAHEAFDDVGFDLSG